MIGSGTLPLGWVWVRIDEVSNVGTGATPLKGNPKYYESGTVSWVTSGLLNELFITKVEEKITELAVKETNAKVFPKHTLLVAMYGEGKTRGKVSELLVEAATNQACAALVFDEEASKLRPFVKLFLQKNYNDIRRLSSGGVQPNLNLGIIKATKVPIPPLNEQHRIVTKIEALKARSQRVKEELEAIPALLDQFRQSVLAAAFRGDLTADLREKNPDVEPASVLLERIRAERRRRWEEAELEKMKAKGKTPKDDKWKEKYKEPESVDDSQLPELPDGWCWAKFETVATIASNLVSPHDYPTSPHIAPDNIEKGSGKLLEYRTIEEDGVTSPKHLFFPGQIVYSKIRPYLSKCIFVDFEGLCSADMYPIDSHICSEYLFRYILSNTFLNLIQQEAGSRVVLPKANQEQVYAIPVPVPPLDEQIVIARKINELLAYYASIKVVIQNQLGKIEELQQSILAKAFQGELVPQDPNDEPASVLLERIRAEREKLDTKKKAKGKTEKKSRKAKPEAAEPEQLSLPGFD